jgi:hypothetical protein
MEHFDIPKQVLGGDVAPVQKDTNQVGLFQERNFQPQLPGPDCRQITLL